MTPPNHPSPDPVLSGDDAVAAMRPFQEQVRPWLRACFGEMIAGDREERNHRFLEEALELVQTCDCTASEAHQLVDYVYGRPIGELHQEVGGVMVTLAALCLANGADMHTAGWVELNRIWGKVDAIRAKQAAKPKHSPLPIPTTPKGDDAGVPQAERERRAYLNGIEDGCAEAERAVFRAFGDEPDGTPLASYAVSKAARLAAFSTPNPAVAGEAERVLREALTYAHLRMKSWSATPIKSWPKELRTIRTLVTALERTSDTPAGKGR